MFSNNNFQFLNTCTKRAPNLSFLEGEISTKKKKKDSKPEMKMKDQKQWEINLQGKVIRLSNANFNMISASLAEIMGWFDMGLIKA